MSEVEGVGEIVTGGLIVALVSFAFFASIIFFVAMLGIGLFD